MLTSLTFTILQTGMCNFELTQVPVAWLEMWLTYTLISQVNLRTYSAKYIFFFFFSFLPPDFSYHWFRPWLLLQDPWNSLEKLEKAWRSFKTLAAIDSSCSSWFELRRLIRGLWPINYLQNFDPNASWYLCISKKFINFLFNLIFINYHVEEFIVVAISDTKFTPVCCVIQKVFYVYTKFWAQVSMSGGLLIQLLRGRVIRRLFRVNFRVTLNLPIFQRLWKRFFWFHVALVWGRDGIRLFSELEIHPQLQACCQVNGVSLGGTRFLLWNNHISFLADYYGATITKSMPSVTPEVVYNFSFMEDISRDPIMECDLPWQDSRISSRWENSDVSLSVSNIPRKFILSTKCSVNFSKLGKGKLHCRAANTLRAE